MKTVSKKFIQNMEESITGLSIKENIPTFKVQDNQVVKELNTPRKMIIRADDVGYTNYCNIGTFQTIEHGVVTSADVMLETPGTVDALERLKDYPWITVGWHAHFWGSPVLEPKQVPSLVIEDDGRIRFRKDLQTTNDVEYEELLMECRAQINRCIKVLGRTPDTGGGGDNSPLQRAIKQICEEYGIARDFAARQSFVDGVMKFSEVNEKWKSRKIYQMSPGTAYSDLRTDSITDLELYDPYKFFSEDRAHIKEIDKDAIVEQSWHPGWVDYFVYRLGDYGPLARNFILARVVDVEALCSDKLKNWLKENNFELINYRDALYGSREYQNHLKLTNSDLAII